MKTCIHKKLIVFIMIQAFLLCNNALASNIFLSDSSQTNCLSPALTIGAQNIREIFESKKVLPELTQDSLMQAFNALFEKGENGYWMTFHAARKDSKYSPAEIQLEWRFATVKEKAAFNIDKQRIAVVIMGRCIYFDPREKPSISELIKKSRGIIGFEKFVVFDKKGMDVEFTETEPFLQRRNIDTVVSRKLKHIVDKFTYGRIRRLHIVNNFTLALLHKAVAEQGIKLEEAREHLKKYRFIYNSNDKKIDDMEMTRLLGDGRLGLTDQIKLRKEEFIQSLIKALKAMQGEGINITDYIEASPLYKTMQRAGYFNIEIVFSKAMEMETINFHASSKDLKKIDEKSRLLIIKRIQRLFKEKKVGEIKFVPTVFSNNMEIYFFDKDEQIVGSLRMTINGADLITLNNVEIYEEAYLRKGLLTKCLKVIYKATDANAKLKNSQIRNLITLLALHEKFFPDAIYRPQIARILQEQIVSKIKSSKIKTGIDISSLNSPLTNACRKAGYSRMLLTVEKGIDDLGSKTDLVTIEAYKQKPVLNQEYDDYKLNKSKIPQKTLFINQSI